MNYIKIYNSIIDKAVSLNRKKNKEIYYEQHHIIPKCIGGLNSRNNLVLLTAKEHYLCHYLLTFIYPDNKSLFFAFWCMINRTSKNQNRIKPSGRIYEEYRLRHSKLQSEKWKVNNPNNSRSNKGKNNPMYGSNRAGSQNPFYNKKHTEESKRKISCSNKGKTGKHNERVIIIDGSEYLSLTIAAKHFNLTISCIYRRLKSKSSTFENYRYKH